MRLSLPQHDNDDDDNKGNHDSDNIGRRGNNGDGVVATATAAWGSGGETAAVGMLLVVTLVRPANELHVLSTVSWNKRVQ